MFKQKFHLLSILGILAIFSAYFSLTYAPVIQSHYLFTDDFFWIWSHLPQEELYKGLLGEGLVQGRLIYGLLKYIIFDYINSFKSIEAANTIRFAGIIGIGLLAYVVYVFLKLNRVKAVHAFLISILICTLPSLQLYVSWVVCVPYIYSALLSAFSALLLFKVVLKGKGEKTFHRVIAVLAAMILLVIAMTIYQPTAMIFWAMIAVPLAMLRDEDLINKWYSPFIIYFAVGVASMAVYFCAVKIVHVSMNMAMDSRGTFISFEHIPYKLFWFLFSPLKNALNLWNIFPTYKMGIFVGIIIVAGLLSGSRHAILQVIKERRLNLLWKHSLRMFFIIIVILLSYLPNLLVVESWATYRTLISLAAVIYLLLCCGFINIVEFFKFVPEFSGKIRNSLITVILIMFTINATYLAHDNVNRYFATLQSKEFSYIKDSIRKYGTADLSEVSKIYVRKPNKKNFIKRGFIYEFGQISSLKNWAIIPMVRLALYESGVNNKISIRIGKSIAPLPEHENVLVIDMTKFKPFQ